MILKFMQITCKLYVSSYPENVLSQTDHKCNHKCNCNRRVSVIFCTMYD